MAQVDGLVTHERLGRLRAPPMELFTPAAPVTPVPLSDDRGDVAVGEVSSSRRSGSCQQTSGFSSTWLRPSAMAAMCSAQPAPAGNPGRFRKMQAPSTSRVPRSPSGSFLTTPFRPCLWNCQMSGVSVGRRPLHVAGVLLPGEVRAVRAAPLRQLGRRTGQHALASVAEDARPGAGQERDVEQPGPFLVGIVEADPLVGHRADSSCSRWPRLYDDRHERRP